MLVIGGCGSSKSASNKVCDAGSDLRQAVTKVTDDLAAANLGAARDDLGAVKDAFGHLQDAAGELKTEAKQAISPSVDAVSSAITSLTNAQSFADVKTAATSVASSLQSLYTQITDTLKCS